MSDYQEQIENAVAAQALHDAEDAGYLGSLAASVEEQLRDEGRWLDD